uniref:DUF6824 domain-containing protein n=1 Tax=Leptocylindrus danicus TaxID=163516 RepID=A0A7S2JXN1_9STRA
MPNQHFVKQTPPAQFDASQFEDAAEDHDTNSFAVMLATPPIPASISITTTTTSSSSNINNQAQQSPLRKFKIKRRNSNESWVSSTSTLTAASTCTTSDNVCTSRAPIGGIRSEERNENDVLLGRGKGPSNYIGNKRFRNLVSQYRPIYFESKRSDKLAIAKSVSEFIRQQEPAGRFLRLDNSTGTWVEVGEQDAIKKTAQLLREGILQRQKKRRVASVVVSQKDEQISLPSLGPLKKRRFVEVSPPPAATSHVQHLPEDDVMVASRFQQVVHNSYISERPLDPFELSYNQVPRVVELFQQPHFSDQQQQVIVVHNI